MYGTHTYKQTFRRRIESLWVLLLNVEFGNAGKHEDERQMKEKSKTYQPLMIYLERKVVISK